MPAAGSSTLRSPIDALGGIGLILVGLVGAAGIGSGAGIGGSIFLAFLAIACIICGIAIALSKITVETGGIRLRRGLRSRRVAFDQIALISASSSQEPLQWLLLTVNGRAKPLKALPGYGFSRLNQRLELQVKTLERSRKQSAGVDDL